MNDPLDAGDGVACTLLFSEKASDPKKQTQRLDRWPLLVILARRKPRQEDCLRFKVILVYMSSRPERHSETLSQ